MEKTFQFLFFAEFYEVKRLLSSSNFETLCGLQRKDFQDVVSKTSIFFRRMHPRMGKMWTVICALTFYYFRNYPTYENFAFIFDIPHQTLERWIDNAIEALHNWAEHSFMFPTRQERVRKGVRFFDCLTTLCVDCTEQCIEKSKFHEIENATFGGKYMVVILFFCSCFGFRFLNLSALLLFKKM